MSSTPLVLTLLAALAAASGVVTGCAVPGEPTARRPVTPEAVQDLAARQQGDAVVLSFTLPRNSTDQEPLPSPPTVEVYRSALAPGGTASGKPVARLANTIPGSTVDTYLKNGRIEFTDALDPAELARNPGQQIVYLVRTRVSGKRASADSNAVSVRAYPAPESVGDLRVTVTEDAILLAWDTPESTADGTAVAGYRVYRAEIEPPSPDAAAASQEPSSSKLRALLALLNQTSQPEYRDAAFQLGHAYAYVVRSIAPFDSDVVESADSNPLAVYAKDVFPPAVPHGLEAIIVPETADVPPYIELAWAISLEPDLAGYAVYRAEQADIAGSRLTPELSSAPTFRDRTVLPGRHYFYRVAAVDRDGNESPQTAPVEAEVPERQP